ncbi:paf acetylhydrolase [Paraphaeosphaeria sporulosa]
MSGKEAVGISQQRFTDGSGASIIVKDEGGRSKAGDEEILEVSSQGTRWRNVLAGRQSRAIGGSSAVAATTAVDGVRRTGNEIVPTSIEVPPATPASTKLSHRRCRLPPLVIIMLFCVVVTGLGLLALINTAHGQSPSASKFEVPAPASSLPWKVAHSRSFLIDSSRKDPYNNTEDRKVAYSIFMPVFAEACSESIDNGYMPTLTAEASNLQFFDDESAGIFDALHFNSCSKNTDKYNADHFPLLIFEPAVGTSRFMYNQLARQLSANGAHVVTIDHPYDANIVEFPGSDPIRNGGSVSLDPFQVNKPVNGTETKKAIDTRIADVDSVIKELEKANTLPRLFPAFTFTDGNTKVPTQRLFMVGHGLGGSVATSMGFYDKRVEWTINLSGSTPVLAEDVYPYTIFFGRENYRSENDTAWQETMKHIAGPQVEWTYHKAEQFDFSDLPLVSHLVNPSKKPKGLGVPYQDMDPNDPTATFRALSCFLEGYFRDTLIPGWFVEPRLPGQSHDAIQKCLGWFGGAMKPHVMDSS